MGGEFRTRQSSQATVSAGSPGMAEEELTRLGLDVARRQPLTLAELERMIDTAFTGARGSDYQGVASGPANIFHAAVIDNNAFCNHPVDIQFKIADIDLFGLT